MSELATTKEDRAQQAHADAPATGEWFLDVETLLETSQPRGNGSWIWMALGGFVLAVLMSTYVGLQSAQVHQALNIVASLAMLALTAGMAAHVWTVVKRHRAEQQQIHAIEEMGQLRRWGEAAGALGMVLSRPTRSPGARVQALLYLTSVLGRYHRHLDAMALEEYLLEHIRLDEGTSFLLRLGRAMSMLHEDRLFDADRAISDLRRAGGGEGRESAALALVEIYRDVKTGHPAEAIAIFKERATALRDQLGQRVADVYALIARAYDMQGLGDEAGENYRKATLLCPAGELNRRYAEVAALGGRYAAAEAPVEAR